MIQTRVARAQREADGDSLRARMTPQRLREIIASTGRDRRELARMLGYGSENSLRQAEAGKQFLADDKVLWLERYAEFRQRRGRLESAWLEKNPPPC